VFVIEYKGISMPGKFIFAFVLFCTFFVLSGACASEAAADEGANVLAAVSGFYKGAQGGRNYRNIGKSPVSNDLYALLQHAKEAEKCNAKEVAESDQPTDKPALLEVALFSSVYEGYSKVLAIRPSINQKHLYMADVDLVYDGEPPPLVWTDTAVVVYENGSWKVDGILFHGVDSKDEGSVKHILHVFVSSACGRKKAAETK
jgi:hypothetical protein